MIDSLIGFLTLVTSILDEKNLSVIFRFPSNEKSKAVTAYMFWDCVFPLCHSFGLLFLFFGKIVLRYYNCISIYCCVFLRTYTRLDAKYTLIFTFVILLCTFRITIFGAILFSSYLPDSGGAVFLRYRGIRLSFL